MKFVRNGSEHTIFVHEDDRKSFVRVEPGEKSKLYKDNAHLFIHGVDDTIPLDGVEIIEGVRDETVTSAAVPASVLPNNGRTRQ